MLPEKGPTKPSEHTLVILPQKVRLDPKATDSQNVVNPIVNHPQCWKKLLDME